MQRLIALFIATSVLAALAPAVARAGDGGKLRMRLREHFDLSRVDFGATDESYFGLSNTVNLWYERNFEWAVGLAFNPVLSSGWDNTGALAAGAPDNVRLWSGGAEGTWYFATDRKTWGAFARGGLFWSLLEVGNAPNPQGFSWYAGVGFEYKVWKVGIIPEVAFRHAVLTRDTQVYSFTPSIAFRFYVLEDILRFD